MHVQGLIGVVTRPVSGVVDFASGTMESVRTVAGAHKEAGALRPPRVIRENRIIRPYSLNEALGYKVFKVGSSGIFGSIFLIGRLHNFHQAVKYLLYFFTRIFFIQQASNICFLTTYDYDT